MAERNVVMMCGNIPPLCTSLLAQQDAVIAPAVVLILCLVAGVGTVLLLPSRREASIRHIGGAVLLAVGLIFAALLIHMAAGNSQGAVGIYFWIFSAIALIGAVRVVTHPKPVYSALYFVLTVFATAGLFLLLWAEFMAAALVLIYAGAILVTYVFVIMLAAEVTPAAGAGSLLEHDQISRDPVLAATVGFTLMGLLLFVIFDKSQAIARMPSAAIDPSNPPIVSGATQELGVYLFQQHTVNVELAGLILTVSMIGAIVIARRRVISDTAQSGGSSSSSMVLVAPATPLTDDPHSIPVNGTRNARQKAFPET